MPSPSRTSRPPSSSSDSPPRPSPSHQVHSPTVISSGWDCVTFMVTPLMVAAAVRPGLMGLGLVRGEGPVAGPSPLTGDDLTVALQGHVGQGVVEVDAPAAQRGILRDPRQLGEDGCVLGLDLLPQPVPVLRGPVRIAPGEGVAQRAGLPASAGLKPATVDDGRV